jgi:hypothetical protein
MHYVSHGWLAGTLALPFVLLAAALEKRHEFAACLFEAVAWFLMNLLLLANLTPSYSELTGNQTFRVVRVATKVR